jgi:hypothetical protein
METIINEKETADMPMNLLLYSQRKIETCSPSSPFEVSKLPIYHKLLKQQRSQESDSSMVHHVMKYVFCDTVSNPAWTSIVLMDCIKFCIRRKSPETDAFISNLQEKLDVWCKWMYSDNMTCRRKSFQLAIALLSLQHDTTTVPRIAFHVKEYFRYIGPTSELREWLASRSHCTEFCHSGPRDVGCIKLSIMVLINLHTEEDFSKRQEYEKCLEMFGSDHDVQLVQLFSDHDEDLVVFLLTIYRLSTLTSLSPLLNPCRLFCRFMSVVEFDEYTLADIILENPQAVLYFLSIVPLVKTTNLADVINDGVTDYAMSLSLTLKDLGRVLEKAELESEELKLLVSLLKGL